MTRPSRRLPGVRMGKSDKHSDDFDEIRDRRQTARGGSREGGRPPRGR
ncbi:hypothetical protein LUW77_12550 [Streptomyces radiopugnans]|nr:hypothetical protein LUW77_12550 [Streptomyces radiopugnans]